MRLVRADAGRLLGGRHCIGRCTIDGLEVKQFGGSGQIQKLSIRRIGLSDRSKVASIGWSSFEAKDRATNATSIRLRMASIYQNDAV